MWDLPSDVQPLAGSGSGSRVGDEHVLVISGRIERAVVSATKPQCQDAVVHSRHHQSPVRACHRVGVRAKFDWIAIGVPGGGIPDPHRLVAAAARQQCHVTQLERTHRRHLAGVADQRVAVSPPGGGIPEPHRLVTAACRQQCRVTQLERTHPYHLELLGGALDALSGTEA